MTDDVKDDPLEAAKARFKMARDAWDENFKRWLDDVKFLAGEQWPQAIKSRRMIPGKERPCLVVDKLNQYVRQVVNDGRQNRPSVKVRPVEDGDVKVADAFQGIIRHICDRSKADQAFDTSLEHAAKGGIGFFRILTEYPSESYKEDPSAFYQELCIARVRNPLAVVIDPFFQKADASDIRFGFIVDDVPKDDFREQFPSAKETDWQDSRFGEGWVSEKTVRVCEYFYKVEEPKVLHLLPDNTAISDEDYQAAVKELGADKVPQPVQSRTIKGTKVKWCRLTGAEILEERDWPGQHIPIIPVFGNEEDIEGKVYYSGLIRKAKDGQMLYNFSRSAFAERVAMTPKAPWITAVEAIEGFEEWDTANTGLWENLRFRAYDGENQLPAPQRIAASDIPGGFAEDMQLAEHDIQSAMGMYNASIGEKSNEKSGRAIMARQREGDTSTFHYQDNQARAIELLGVQLVDLIPKVYDSKRVIRILGEDGKATPAQIDPDQDEAVRKGPDGLLIYNLGAGEYDVSVDAGPSYTTKRQEAVEAMMQLTQNAPQFLQVAGDIMVRNMDWPGAQEIADRLKKMLPPQLQDQGGDDSPEVQAVKAQASQIINNLQQGMQQAQQAIEQLSKENADLKAGHDIDAAEVDVKGYQAETDRLTALAPALTPESIAGIVQQTVAAIMQQPVPTQSPGPPPDLVAPPLNQPPPGGFLLPGAQ